MQWIFIIVGIIALTIAFPFLFWIWLILLGMWIMYLKD